MSIFHLLLDLDERLDVEHALQLLKKEFPSVTVEGDTFERKRQRLAANLAALSEEGNPIRNPELFHRELARNEAESGPGMDVIIAVDDTTKIAGSIMSGGIRLSSNNRVSPDNIQQVEKYLNSLNIGRVTIAER